MKNENLKEEYKKFKIKSYSEGFLSEHDDCSNILSNKEYNPKSNNTVYEEEYTKDNIKTWDFNEIDTESEEEPILFN